MMGRGTFLKFVFPLNQPNSDLVTAVPVPYAFLLSKYVVGMSFPVGK
jgi:hypothetical protein